MISKDNSKIRYLLGLLSLGLAIGVFFSYLWLHRVFLPQDSVSEYIDFTLQVLVEIFAALIIFPIIYFLLVRKGIDPSLDFKEEIKEEIRKSLSPGNKGFINQIQASKIFDIQGKLDQGHDIYLLAYSSVYLLTDIRKEFEKAILNKGSNIKVLIVRPQSRSSQLINSYLIIKDIENDLKESILMLKELKDNVNQKQGIRTKGSIEVRTIDWIPSCSLIFAIDRKSKNGKLKLKVNSPFMSTPLSEVLTHQVIDSEQEPDVFQYLFDQFNEKLWKTAEPIDFSLWQPNSGSVP